MKGGEVLHVLNSECYMHAVSDAKCKLQKKKIKKKKKKKRKNPPGGPCVAAI